jgi:hypothetical protein
MGFLMLLRAFLMKVRDDVKMIQLRFLTFTKLITNL